MCPLSLKQLRLLATNDKIVFKLLDFSCYNEYELTAITREHWKLVPELCMDTSTTLAITITMHQLFKNGAQLQLLLQSK